MVEVASTIELDRSLEANGSGHIMLGHSLGQLLLGNIEIVDVCGVVAAVVKLHDLRTYHRLQCVVVIGQVGEAVLATGTETKDQILSLCN